MKRFFTSFLLIFSISVFAQKYTVSDDLIDQYTTDASVNVILSTTIDTDGFYAITL